MAIPKYVPKKYQARVMFWDDERSLGNALIIILNDGWRFTMGDAPHVIGVDTVSGALEALRSTVECCCEGCRKDLWTETK